MSHPGRIPDCQSPSSVPWGNRAHANHLQLESLYQASPFALSAEGPAAHAVTLVVEGWLGQEAVRAQLLVDPNACALSDFGDRLGRPRIATRRYDVALTRLRAADPEALGRTLFAITGAGLPEDLYLIMYPYGDRVYLKLRDALLPLYFNDGPLPASARR